MSKAVPVTEVLGDRLLVKSDGGVTESATNAVIEGKYIGIYFSGPRRAIRTTHSRHGSMLHRCLSHAHNKTHAKKRSKTHAQNGHLLPRTCCHAAHWCPPCRAFTPQLSKVRLGRRWGFENLRQAMRHLPINACELMTWGRGYTCKRNNCCMQAQHRLHASATPAAFKHACVGVCKPTLLPRWCLSPHLFPRYCLSPHSSRGVA